MNEPEFSRIIIAERIPPAGLQQDIEANEKERAALARRFGLASLSRLAAHFSLMPGLNGSVRVTGELKAEATQSCVVTLEPVPATVAAPISVTFLAGGEGGGGEDLPADDLDEEIETLSGGKIDLGELAAQIFGVNLDPYPRRPGVALPPEFAPAPEKIRPMAQLAALAKKAKNDDKT